MINISWAIETMIIKTFRHLRSGDPKFSGAEVAEARHEHPKAFIFMFCFHLEYYTSFTCFLHVHDNLQVSPAHLIHVLFARYPLITSPLTLHTNQPLVPYRMSAGPSRRCFMGSNRERINRDSAYHDFAPVYITINAGTRW